MSFRGCAAVSALCFLLSACATNAPHPSTMPNEWAITRYFPDQNLDSEQGAVPVCRPSLCKAAETYGISRKRFLDWATQRGGEISTIAVPGRTETDLAIDTAFFRSRAPKALLVVQSGIHGSEAVPGAAVLFLFMDKWLAKFQAAGVDVYLIHAVDPWGYKHDRRTEEHNINLNRNFPIWDGTAFQPVYSSPAALVSHYEDYRPLFEPQGEISSVDGERTHLTVAMALSYLSNGFSTRPVTVAFGAGQYTSHEGINFGGDKMTEPNPTAQTLFYRNQAAAILNRPDYSKVLVLDLHTGLGDAGVLSVIEGISPPRDLLDSFSRQIGLDGEACKSKTFENAGEIMLSTSACDGFFPTFGDVIDFVPNLRPSGRVLAVTMEYGTLGGGTWAQIDSAATMILENQKYVFGKCASAQVCKQIEDDFTELFNPSSPSWRTKILNEADFVFSRLEGWF